MTTVRARQIRSGDTILVDRLDLRSAWEVAEASQTQYADEVTLYLWRPTEGIAEAVIPGDALVGRLS